MGANKRVLLIAPEFFGYARRIMDEMAVSGFLVDLITTLDTEFTFRILSLDRRLLELKNKYIDNHYERTFKLFSNYDKILIIHGVHIPDDALKLLKKQNPNAEFILYIWDEMKKAKYSDSFLHLFDKKFTFNIFDADDYSLIFQPFFYSEQLQLSKTVDVSFVGTLHSRRNRIITDIKQSIDPKITFETYLHIPLVRYLRTYRSHKASFKDIKTRPMTYAEYITLVSRSKALLEIPHFEQKNITTRPIEVLGCSTKIITNSTHIRRFDFYTEENTFIYDEKYNFDDLDKWLAVPYRPQPDEILHKYSLKCWIQNIFGFK